MKAPERFRSEGDLRHFLHSYGVHTESWGRGSKDVDDLYEELSCGETRLVLRRDGTVLRLKRAAAARVLFNDQGRQLMLQRKEQVFRNGTVRSDFSDRLSISEKLQPKEKAKKALIRGLGEELQLDPPFSIRPRGTSVDIAVSKTFPGLVTKSTRHRFDVHLHPEQYNPDGYIEEQPKKTTYFGWKPLPCTHR